MPRPVSDHLPILLKGWGSLFRGLPFLLGLKICGSMRQGSRTRLTIGGRGWIFKGLVSFIVMEILKALKLKLKTWNKEVFGKMEDRKKQALDNVAIMGWVR